MGKEKWRNGRWLLEARPSVGRWKERVGAFDSFRMSSHKTDRVSSTLDSLSAQVGTHPRVFALCRIARDPVRDFTLRDTVKVFSRFHGVGRHETIDPNPVPASFTFTRTREGFCSSFARGNEDAFGCPCSPFRPSIRFSSSRFSVGYRIRTISPLTTFCLFVDCRASCGMSAFMALWLCYTEIVGWVAKTDTKLISYWVLGFWLFKLLGDYKKV